MKLKNLKVARWTFFIFHFLFNCLRYKQNNDRYKQVQTKYKRSAILIFIFDKAERRFTSVQKYQFFTYSVFDLFTQLDTESTVYSF